MIASSHTPFLAGASPLAGIILCLRQICLLREQGNEAEAARLEQNEFATAVRDIRLAHGPDALPENELRALYSTEEKRVADAAVLSALLVPQLVKLLPLTAAQPPSARSSDASVNGRDSATSFPRTAAAGDSPAITDLLDAMLNAERTGRRPLSSPRS